jgi:hypothetical protein
MNTPVRIVIMVAGLFVTIYIVQAILNTIGAAVPTPANATFNATSDLGTSWSNVTQFPKSSHVDSFGWKILVVPIALNVAGLIDLYRGFGWYLLCGASRLNHLKIRSIQFIFERLDINITIGTAPPRRTSHLRWGRLNSAPLVM